MAIDWGSILQRCVTTSTTEAELVSLSIAGGLLKWWTRFFEQVGYDPEIIPTLLCDNDQAVKLVTRADGLLPTKMKHVDIRTHWTREKCQTGELKVLWTPTAMMPADGFTKCLPRQKLEEFRRLIGMVDVTKVLTGEDLSDPDPLLPESLRYWY